VRELAERAWFLLCSALGRLLRSARYSKVRIVQEAGERRVRKHRAFYAPLLVRLGNPLLRILDTGVQILPQGEWEARERLIYGELRGASIRTDEKVLVLPCLEGRTLAAVLDDPEVAVPVRERAIVLAVEALAAFHARGFTHGDAMAENVLVDLEEGVAHWFDFETVHETSRPLVWCRADDVRALVATCLVRTPFEHLAGRLRTIMEAYDDEAVTRVLPAWFSTGLQRPLVFHLGQAGLSYRYFRKIGRLLAVGPIAP
jgi:hypothetical protein